MKYLIIIGIIVLAWCPWLKADEALKIVDAKVIEMRKIPDLCKLSVNKASITKVPFGYTEEYFYDCTVNDSVYGVEKSNGVIFVTFYKGTIGMTTKILKRSP